QSFFRADVIPDARHAPNVKRSPRIKPLHEAAGLIRIVAFGDVLPDQRQNRFWIIVQSDPSQRAFWMFRFLFKKGYAIVFIDLNRVVLLDLLQVRNVVHGQDRRILTATELAEPFQALTEKIVARNDHEVIIDLGLVKYEIQVADRPEPVRLARSLVIDDVHWRT